MSDASRGDGPLTGLVVIDLSTVMMGPFATQILGDLGARVIKIESRTGDVTRAVPPVRTPGLSGISLNLNRNKESMALDLKSAQGRDIARALLDRADAVVTNMRAGALERLGLCYEEVAESNPRLVYCLANGFRLDSDRAGQAAYDDIIQAATGVVDLSERLTGSPSYAPMVMADKVCGLMIALSVQAALLERSRSGTGQLVEVPMADVMLTFNLMENLATRTFEPVQGGTGYARSLSPSRRPWPTRDGWVCIMPYSDQNWRDFFAFTDEPAYGEDPRFATFGERTKNVDDVYRIASSLTPQHSTREWLDYSTGKGIPATSVLRLDDAVDDPYFRSLLTEQTHPVDGDYRLLSHPVRYSRTPWALSRHCPRVGEQSRDLLLELGYVEEEIDVMVTSGVVGTAQPERQQPSAVRVRTGEPTR